MEMLINGSTSLKLRGGRACRTCGRFFRSGKAFGGHWKRHKQQNRRRGPGGKLKVKALGERELERNEKKNTITTVTNDHLDRRNEIICYVCDKTFYSLRSLSGHMRSHPNRFWRGVQPPPPAAAPLAVANRVSSSSSVSMMSEVDGNDDDCTDTAISTVDLSKNLPRSWSRTGKRGRKSAEVAAAADGLLNLSRRECRNPKKHIMDLSPQVPLAMKRKVRTVFGKGTLWRISTTYDHQGEEDIKDLKGKNVIGTSCDGSEKKWENLRLEEKKRDFASSSSSTVTDVNVSLLSSAAKTHHKKVDVTTNRYKCSSCDRSFPTFQGLGGHRSIHNKKVTTPSTTEKKKTGHISSNSVPSPPNQVADSGPETAPSELNIRGGQSGRVFLDFDLNELPFGMP